MAGISPGLFDLHPLVQGKREHLVGAFILPVGALIPIGFVSGGLTHSVSCPMTSSLASPLISGCVLTGVFHQGGCQQVCLPLHLAAFSPGLLVSDGDPQQLAGIHSGETLQVF